MATIAADTPAVIDVGFFRLSFQGDGVLGAAFGTFAATHAKSGFDFGIRRSDFGGYRLHKLGKPLDKITGFRFRLQKVVGQKLLRFAHGERKLLD